MAITSKGNKGGYTNARFTDSGFITPNLGTVNGANSVNETVDEMSISSVFWTISGTNTWTIARGANTVLILNGNGNKDFQDDAIPLELNSFERSANVVVTKSGGNGTLVIKLHKKSTIT